MLNFCREAQCFLLSPMTSAMAAAAGPGTTPRPVKIRTATALDAPAVAAIYAPLVEGTSISFESVAPEAAEMRERITATLTTLPWLVGEDAQGFVCGYAYAGAHRARPAYRWSVDVTVYVRADARGCGVGRALAKALLEELTALGYAQAFAGIALPNAASVALHESLGFEAIGIYRRVGWKLGAWRDVGWWQRALRDDAPPAEPRPFRAIG